MAQHVIHEPMRPTVPVRRASGIHSPSYQAYQILHIAFVLAPVLAGADKFFGFLTYWDQYLSPTYARLAPASLGVHGFMMLVGVVEIAAGILVAVRPRLGAYVVAVWLAAIIVNLILLGRFFDVALRDLGLCLGAIALGRLSDVYDRRGVEEEGTLVRSP
jgi:hypothetical protein